MTSRIAAIATILSVASILSGAELKVVTEENVPVPMRDGTILSADGPQEPQHIPLVRVTPLVE